MYTMYTSNSIQSLCNCTELTFQHGFEAGIRRVTQFVPEVHSNIILTHYVSCEGFVHLQSLLHLLHKLSVDCQCVSEDNK